MLSVEPISCSNHIFLQTKKQGYVRRKQAYRVTIQCQMLIRQGKTARCASLLFTLCLSEAGTCCRHVKREHTALRHSGTCKSDGARRPAAQACSLICVCPKRARVVNTSGSTATPPGSAQSGTKSRKIRFPICSL